MICRHNERNDFHLLVFFSFWIIVFDLVLVYSSDNFFLVFCFCVYVFDGYLCVYYLYLFVMILGLFRCVCCVFSGGSVCFFFAVGGVFSVGCVYVFFLFALILFVLQHIKQFNAVNLYCY